MKPYTSFRTIYSIQSDPNEQSNTVLRSTHDLTNRPTPLWDWHTILVKPGIFWYHLLRPPEEFHQRHAERQDQRDNTESISTNIIQKRKQDKWLLTRFDSLPTSLEQKREDLIRTTELQGLQSDPKIQLEKLPTMP